MAAFAQLASVRHQQCRMYEFLMGAVLSRLWDETDAG
jgi:hypothetical protein